MEQLLSKSLLEWTRDSTTTFIKSADNKELLDLAKKSGIKIPSPDIALFKTIYCEIDKVNRNGVILPRKAAEKGLPTLVGKQINWEHDGAGRICGHIIGAKIEGNKIVIYGVLFKSLFMDEFDQVEELFAQKKLFVSFEIWNITEKGESVVHNLSNGHKSLDPIIFHGCGLLLENPPACPNARVLKLLASQKVLEEAEQIVKKIFEKDNRLVCAELAIGEPKCKGCNPCTCHKAEQVETSGSTGTVKDKILKKVEEINMSELEKTKDKVKDNKPIEESKEIVKKEEVKEEAQEKVTEKSELEKGKEKIEDVKKKEDKSEETTEKAETKPEEVAEEKSEAKTTPEEVKKEKSEATPEENKSEAKTTEKSEIKAEEKVEVKDKKTEAEPKKVKAEDKKEDKAEETKEEALKVVTERTVKEVDDMKDKKEVITTDVKESRKVVDDNGKEIRKVEVKQKTVVTYTQAQVDELKATHIKAIEEKDKAIAKLTKELDEVSQEIDKIKVEKATIETKEKATLEVGEVSETNGDSSITTRAKEINKIIAKKHDR